MVAEQEFKQFFQHGGTLLFIILHSHTVHNEISFKPRPFSLAEQNSKVRK